MAEPATEAPEPEYPAGLTPDALKGGMENLLRTESWDTLTIKVIMAKLEESLLPQQPPGTLKPVKKVIKEMMDTVMKQILVERQEQEEKEKAEAAAKAEAEAAAAAAAAAAAEKKAKEDAAAAKASIEADSDEEDAQAAKPPPGKRQRVTVADDDDSDDEAPTGREAMVEEDDDDDEVAASPSKKAAAAAAASDEEDEEDDDPDAPKVSGKPTYKDDGKLFYDKMTKGKDTFRVGQDVYLENEKQIPYVARLQEIFVYAFAPSEVYFNARWYYRVGDVHEYARMSGATRDVQFEGEELEAHEKELFFSLHMDENHADCIMRTCKVHLLRSPETPKLEAWDAVAEERHEYVAWRAYDNKHVYSLASLPSKKLKDAAELEVKRGPQELIRQLAKSATRARARIDDMPTGPLTSDELQAVWLPRRHMEIWFESEGGSGGSRFQKVALGTLVRCAQLINNTRTFYVAYVMGTRHTNRFYRVKERSTDLALIVRTTTGTRMVGIDALSNEPIKDDELKKFKVPLDPEQVRKKIRGLQRQMQDDAELFEAEELQRRYEQEERLRQQREEAARAKAAEEEAAERKEREREELRRRAAGHAKGNEEAWWLQYTNKAGDKEREIAKVRARLLRFRKIAESSTAEGERENAVRLAEQAEAKLAQLTEEADDMEEAPPPAEANGTSEKDAKEGEDEEAEEQ